MKLRLIVWLALAASPDTVMVGMLANIRDNGRQEHVLVL